MNPSHILSRFFMTIIILCFTPAVVSFTDNTISYAEHCNSFAPEAIPTEKESIIDYPFLEPVTSHYSGGQNILDEDPLLKRSILFRPTQNFFKTNIKGTFKIQAQLTFFLPNIYNHPSKFTRVRSNHKLIFYLDGFWSLSRNKFCMVGSAPWFSKQGNPLKLDAVLKLRFGRFRNFKTSIVSGILESLTSLNNSNYFDPVSLLGFPRVSSSVYQYTLACNRVCRGGKVKTRQESVTSMQTLEVCSIFDRKFTTYKLEYPSNCKNCSLNGQERDYLPSFVSLYGIQCSPDNRKLRFLIEFQDRRFTPDNQSFNPNISFIGEGTWNETKGELCIVGCHILSHIDPLSSVRFWNCSTGMTLWFPTFRSIKTTHTTEGIIWAAKITDDMGSFRF